jgi:hypothetical protein
MTITSTLTAHQLGELLRRTSAHVGRHSRYAAIRGVRLDCDGEFLHAVATDRCALAVARQPLRNTTPAWAMTIAADEEETSGDLAALTAWVRSHPGEEDIHLSPAEGRLTATSSRGTLALRADGGHYPDWRAVCRSAMPPQQPDSPAPDVTLLDTELLQRWAAAGREVGTWQTGPGKPLAVVAAGFLGLQMPLRTREGQPPAEPWAAWQAALGEGPSLSQEETFHPHEPAELAEKDLVPATVEDLLKQVLRSTSGMFNTATDDTAALTAYTLAGIHAWTAYRLAKALQQADPTLLRTVLTDTHEQLESGEISEWAWDEATKAGHDPQKWHDDYEAHLKQLAAEKVPDEAGQPTS